MEIRVKRIYEPVSESDGDRVLVDRLWPYGFSEADACVDAWVSELGPTTELRRWFGHDAARFEEFRRRYRSELANKERQLDDLCERARERGLTLVHSARDIEHNNALVLAEVLRERSASASRRTPRPHRSAAAHRPSNTLSEG